MRNPTVKRAICSCTIVAVSMSLAATVVYSQSRPRSSARTQSRSEWQQGQGMSSQAGQPDFVRRMQERHARQMQEMQQDMEEMQRWAEENRNRAIQQTLRATDDQWRQLKPKLDRIERLKAEAEVSAGPGSAGGNGNFQGQGFMFAGVSAGGAGAAFGDAGGMDSSGAPSDNWSNSWTTGPKNQMEMTEGETLCQELHHLLRGESVSALQIAEKVAALRKVRAKAREDLARTRQELCGLMLPHQEPALIVMGYLD